MRTANKYGKQTNKLHFALESANFTEKRSTSAQTKSSAFTTPFIKSF